MKNCVQGFPECTRIGGWFGYQIGQKWGFRFGNEGSDWITLGSEFFAVKGRLPATPTSLKSTAFPLGLENFGVNPWSVGSLDNCFGFNWGMDVENGSEGGGKLICKVGCIGSWLCVERGSKNVTFEVVNINGIVVLWGRNILCGARMGMIFCPHAALFSVPIVWFMHIDLYWLDSKILDSIHWYIIWCQYRCLGSYVVGRKLSSDLFLMGSKSNKVTVRVSILYIITY